MDSLPCLPFVVFPSSRTIDSFFLCSFHSQLPRYGTSFLRIILHFLLFLSFSSVYLRAGEVPRDVMHHGEHAIVDWAAVLLEVLQQQTVRLHHAGVREPKSLAVLRIWIRIRIHMFLGLLDPSIIKQKKVRKTLISTFCDFFLKWYKVPSKSNMQKNLFKNIIVLLASWRSMMKIKGSGSESINQRHGSADPDPNPHQNVMDPQHWSWVQDVYHTTWANVHQVVRGENGLS